MFCWIMFCIQSLTICTIMVKEIWMICYIGSLSLLYVRWVPSVMNVLEMWMNWYVICLHFMPVGGSLFKLNTKFWLFLHNFSQQNTWIFIKDSYYCNTTEQTYTTRSWAHDYIMLKDLWKVYTILSKLTIYK